MFYQIFLSPQVKRWAIITYKHGIYEFAHELANDLSLNLRSQKTRKYQEGVSTPWDDSAAPKALPIPA